MTKVIDRLKDVHATHSVLTIGNFDGLHLGHQSLIQRLLTLKKERNSTSALLTFQNPPITILKPNTPITSILTQEHKLFLLKKYAIDLIINIPFTSELSKLTAEDFLGELKDKLHFTHLILGYDARLGRGREGTPEKIQLLGKKLNFTAEYLPPVTIHGNPISSTLIRLLISEGKLHEVQPLLGRPYSILETPSPGIQMATKLGFPTINLDLTHLILPPLGVWTAHLIPHPAPPLPCIINIGFAPTLKESRNPLLEAHLLNGPPPPYQLIEVVPLTFLRPEQKFSSLDELKRQVQQDVETAKSFFKLKR